MNAAVDKVSVSLRSPSAILSYPHLFVPFASPQDIKNGKQPKYSCSLLFDAEAQATAEWAALKAEANRVALECFKERLPDMVKNGDFKTPFIIGDKFAHKNPEAAGKIMLRCNTKVKPQIVDQQLRPVTDDSAIYPGLIVKVSLGCYPYFPTKENPQMGNGVSFGLRNVQIVAAGTPLGNRTRPEDDFVPLGEAAAAGGANPADLF